MPDEKHIRFYQVLEVRLNDILKRFFNEPLTPKVMHEMRNTIRQQLEDVFMKSRFRLTPIALSWLTDQYFKGIKINDNQMMNDQIIINEHPLSELQFNDIELMRNLFSETTMGEALEEEYRKRTSS